MSTWLIGLEVLLPLMVVLLHRLRGRTPSTDLILNFPALLAPLALVYPWAAVPDHLGVGLAEPAFFLHWLTEYPNLGPVNYEVLLGILCILAASLVPAGLAIYRLAGGHRGVVVILLAVATVAAYVPVLIRLDAALWFVGMFGSPTLLGPVHTYEAACGPLVRGLAALAAIVGAFRATLAMKRPALQIP